jgi:hypothetical protein
MTASAAAAAAAAAAVSHAVYLSAPVAGVLLLLMSPCQLGASQIQELQ